VSEFDNLKNEAEQYAQQHPQQIKEGEDAVEKKFGMGQGGPQDQYGQGQQDQGTYGQGQQDQYGQGQQDQQDQYGQGQQDQQDQQDQYGGDQQSGY
jgi:hypothetical protein